MLAMLLVKCFPLSPESLDLLTAFFNGLLELSLL
jgi:hypothetical protein